MEEIGKQYINAKTRAGFQTALDSGKVSDSQVAFIEDEDLIWARGKYYGTIPNEEDLTKDTEGKLQLSDRSYNPENFSGLGRIILRKNMSAGKNILTQEMISQANTVYEIRYDFDLSGATINIPENCTLDFQGGSFKNGTLNGNNTKINSDVYLIFKNIIINGTWLVINIYSKWFDFGTNDDIQRFKNLISLTSSNIDNTVYIDVGNYNTSKTNNLFNLKNNTSIKLTDKTIINLLTTNTSKEIVFNIINCNNINIEGGTIIGEIRTHILSSPDSSDEWGHCVKISGGSNITIKNMIIKEHMGDGVDLIDYNGPIDVEVPTNILIENVICDNNGRQGFSIEAGKNIILRNCKGINTGQIKYVKPSAGLDIEPWREKGIINNLLVERCEFTNNKNLYSVQFGFGLYGDNYWETVYEDIKFKDCTVDGQFIFNRANGVEIENIKILNNDFIAYFPSPIANISFNNINDIKGIDIQSSNAKNILIKNSNIKEIILYNINNLDIVNVTVDRFEINNCSNIKIEKLQHYPNIITENKGNSLLRNIAYLNFNDCVFNDFVLDSDRIIGYYTITNSIINTKKNNTTSFHRLKDITNCIINLNSNIILSDNVRDTSRALKYKISGNNINILSLTGNTCFNAHSVNTDDIFYFSNNNFNKYINKDIIKIGVDVGNEKIVINNSIDKYTNSTNYEISDGSIEIKGYNINTFLKNKSKTITLITSGNNSDFSNLSIISKGELFFNTDTNTLYIWDGKKWNIINSNPTNIPKKGTTAQRPTGVQIGFTYKDTDLNKWIIWNGEAWENIDGSPLE